MHYHSSWPYAVRFLVAWMLLLLVSRNIEAQSVNDAADTVWTNLFDGKTLGGWQGAVVNYEVVDGNLQCKVGKGGVLFTEKEYQDFEVELEFRLPVAGNNGLAIRYPGHGTASVDAMCELQILDDEAEIYKGLDPRQYNGSIYGMVAAKRGHLKPIGEWNHQKVTVVGSTIRVELNGVEIVHADVSAVREFKDGKEHPGKDLRRGFFGLAGHNDPVAFRNIRLREIKPWKFSSFSIDVTIPVGHRCMGILPQKSVSISDPLSAHGWILRGPNPSNDSNKPIAYVAFDWCELRNQSYDDVRQAIADAIGTDRSRVLVSCLHQHDAPIMDRGAAELLVARGLKDELYSEAFYLDVLKRLAVAANDAIKHEEDLTHVGWSQAKVDSIASNRRFVDPDGRITFARGSGSGREKIFRDAEEGLIDPWLRTLSFWNGDHCLLELHSYATHPMSFYGKGEVSSDFVGLARRRRQRETRGTLQVYASGCSGDVTAGKYNDGSIASREVLIERLHRSMVESSKGVQRKIAPEISFRAAPLVLEYSRKDELSRDSLTKILDDATRNVEQRILAAMGLSSRNRAEANQSIDFVGVDFGIGQVVLFPGESFVGLQRMAEELNLASPVLPIGYGECWPGYIPTDDAFREGFSENWLWVAPGSQDRVRECLKQVTR